MTVLFSSTHTASPNIYPLSLHDALPIYRICMPAPSDYNNILIVWAHGFQDAGGPVQIPEDRKSTRLNSSHQIISYAVFCLKKKSDRRSGRDDRRLAASHDAEVVRPAIRV